MKPEVCKPVFVHWNTTPSIAISPIRLYCIAHAIRGLQSRTTQNLECIASRHILHMCVCISKCLLLSKNVTSNIGTPYKRDSKCRVSPKRTHHIAEQTSVIRLQFSTFFHHHAMHSELAKLHVFYRGTLPGYFTGVVQFSRYPLWAGCRMLSQSKELTSKTYHRKTKHKIPTTSKLLPWWVYYSTPAATATATAPATATATLTTTTQCEASGSLLQFFVLQCLPIIAWQQHPRCPSF